MMAVDSVSPHADPIPGQNHNNTMSVEIGEYNRLLDVAIAVHAFLHKGLSHDRLERAYLRYSESCDAHLDEVRKLAERDKAERATAKLRGKRLLALKSALDALDKQLRRTKSGDKVGYLLARDADEARKAAAGALEVL